MSDGMCCTLAHTPVVFEALMLLTLLQQIMSVQKSKACQPDTPFFIFCGCDCMDLIKLHDKQSMP